jgi:hypothetical protein
MDTVEPNEFNLDDLLPEEPPDYWQTRSPTDPVSETLQHYRKLLQVPAEISDSQLIKLIAENDFIPNQPADRAREHANRPLLLKLRDWLIQVDETYFSWMDTRSGKILAIVGVSAFLGWVYFPFITRSYALYQEGYRACQIYAEVGQRCP